jgi:DNA-binding CsgD family transcriptional regulator
MLAEATVACFFAGNPAEMLVVAQRALSQLSDESSVRARFLASSAIGMARIVGGDAAAGAAAMRDAIALAESSAELRDELRLQPWLAAGPVFLREAGTGRWLLVHALRTARERAAIGALPVILNMVARDQATTDRWALAEGTYGEACDLARESDQQTALVFALSGLAWLHARRGREFECRACAAEALELSPGLGTKLHEIWATAALGELELGLGNIAAAAEYFEDQRRRLGELGITDADLSPAPDLVDAYLRLGRVVEAELLAVQFATAADAKGQAWSVARGLRCRALVALDADATELFERALIQHERTPDPYETARTRLAYGQRLRRARNRVLAREQLRAATDTFERLDARPWVDQARAELAATGVTVRRRDPSTIDDLTPQELQIAALLVDGKTTREAATALFLSPKTIEYHLRHVYRKLAIHSRDELRQALGTRLP